MENKRNSILITHNGEKLSLIDWSTKVGINYSTLIARYHKGLRSKDLFKPTKGIKYNG